MKELSTDAQHLVGLTRGVDGPKHDRRDAVRVGLHAALAAGTTSAAVNAALADAALATPTTIAAGAASAVKGALLGNGMVGGVLTGIGLGTAVLATAHFTTLPRSETVPSANSVSLTAATARMHREARPTSTSSAPVLVSPPPAGVTAVLRTQERMATNPRSLAPVETVVARVETNTTATLADETRLLAETQLAIRSSDPERALALLGEYEHRFSNGSLREEARAARVLALCKAGRLEAGRTAAAHFEREFPNSPLVPRVRRSCDLMR